MSNSKQEKFKLAPLRSINDFILDTSKYLAPPYNDLRRFNNRVTSNLLYYQTNYFATSALVFLIFLLLQFNKLVTGAFGLGALVLAALFTFDKIPQIKDLRAKYPPSIFGVWTIGLIIVHLTFRPILFLTLVVLVPMVSWFAHASTRSRGLKNKINNKVEQISGGQVYNNTPMGYVLLSLGVEARDLDE